MGFLKETNEKTENTTNQTASRKSIFKEGNHYDNNVFEVKSEYSERERRLIELDYIRFYNLDGNFLERPEFKIEKEFSEIKRRITLLEKEREKFDLYQRHEFDKIKESKLKNLKFDFEELSNVQKAEYEDVLSEALKGISQQLDDFEEIIENKKKNNFLRSVELVGGEKEGKK